VFRQEKTLHPTEVFVGATILNEENNDATFVASQLCDQSKVAEDQIHDENTSDAAHRKENVCIDEEFKGNDLEAELDLKKKRGKKSASILNYTWLSITKCHNVKTEAEFLNERLLMDDNKRGEDDIKKRYRRLVEKAQAQRTRLDERLLREKHESTIYEVRLILNRFPREHWFDQIIDLIKPI